MAISLALLAAAITPVGTHELFEQYNTIAEQKVQQMSESEKIGQVLLARYPGANAATELKQYQFGGYVFFEKDFQGKTSAEVQKMMADLQAVVKIPILTAVDEEGGSVVRVSSNKRLAPARFMSPQELYNTGGLTAIRKDVEEKTRLLTTLGINLNLAPVVDVSTDPQDYMYKRSIGQNTAVTSEYAKTVILASQGTDVSYTLKHFPGYGNNSDTHQGSSEDNRTLAEILQHDLPPFHAGIEAGAEAVLVSHNIVDCLDSARPASLSPVVNSLLREALGFTGVVITDDIVMAALEQSGDTAVQALNAGNDLVITTDYQKSVVELGDALRNGRLSQTRLDEAVKRVVAWKYNKGLLTEGLYRF